MRNLYLLILIWEMIYKKKCYLKCTYNFNNISFLNFPYKKYNVISHLVNINFYFTEHLSTISSIKGDLPLVLIEDRYEFAEWGDLIEQKNYYTISEDVKAYVNIIFFDKMYMQDFDVS